MKRIKLDKETHNMYSLRRRGTLGNGIELSMEAIQRKTIPRFLETALIDTHVTVLV